MDLIGTSPRTLAVITGAYDVTSKRSVGQLAAATAEAGVLGALVHTAGLSPVQATWDTVVSVNLTGTALLLDAFGPLAKPGSVAVCIGSSAGYTIPVPAAVDALLDDPCAEDLIPKLAALLREAGTDEAGYGFAVRAYGASKRGMLRRPARRRRRGRGPAAPAPPVQLAHQKEPAMPTEIPRRFEGKVAFITGAARGQGRAEAVRLAAEGADLIALDICADLPTTSYPGPTPADLAETARLVEKYDRRIVTSITDVRDYDGVRAAVERGVAELGRLDVVVANAGMTTSAPAWEIPLENWDATIGICLTGAYYTARAAIPIMIEQGTGGVIVFTSSVAGLVGLPLLADYVAAKHGVTGLAKTLANELGKYRIRVNTVHPHGVNTDLKPGLRERLDGDPGLGPLFMGALPDPVSEPEDIAAAVAWLASDEARHVTGIQLPVDLGRTNR